MGAIWVNDSRRCWIFNWDVASRSGKKCPSGLPTMVRRVLDRSIRRLCQRLTASPHEKLEALFVNIIEEGGYEDVDARALATGYSALIDGLHLGLLVSPRELSKRHARSVARDFLRRAFPHHIS